MGQQSKEPNADDNRDQPWKLFCHPMSSEFIGIAKDISSQKMTGRVQAELFNYMDENTRGGGGNSGNGGNGGNGSEQAFSLNSLNTEKSILSDKT
ncbi:hypothetical protein MaudCBS49596_003490 [Microsporum audouinii]